MPRHAAPRGRRAVLDAGRPAHNRDASAPGVAERPGAAARHACGEPVDLRRGGVLHRWCEDVPGGRTRRRRALSRPRLLHARSAGTRPRVSALSSCPRMAPLCARGPRTLAILRRHSLGHGARARACPERLRRRSRPISGVPSNGGPRARLPPATGLSHGEPPAGTRSPHPPARQHPPPLPHPDPGGRRALRHRTDQPHLPGQHGRGGSSSSRGCTRSCPPKHSRTCASSQSILPNAACASLVS